MAKFILSPCGTSILTNFARDSEAKNLIYRYANAGHPPDVPDRAYEAEGFEPGVPPLGQRIETFQALSVGIEHNKCIDDELILRITDGPQRSIKFEKFLGYERQGDLFAQPQQSHGCIYCYANYSAASVVKNRLKIRVENEALV